MPAGSIRLFVVAVVVHLGTAIFRGWALDLIEYFSWPDLPRFAMASVSGLALYTLLQHSCSKSRSTTALLFIASGVASLEVIVQLSAALLSATFCGGMVRGPVSVISASFAYWTVAHLWVSVRQ